MNAAQLEQQCNAIATALAQMAVDRVNLAAALAKIDRKMADATETLCEMQQALAQAQRAQQQAPDHEERE